MLWKLKIKEIQWQNDFFCVNFIPEFGNNMLYFVYNFFPTIADKDNKDLIKVVRVSKLALRKKALNFKWNMYMLF